MTGVRGEKQVSTSVGNFVEEGKSYERRGRKKRVRQVYRGETMHMRG